MRIALLVGAIALSLRLAAAAPGETFPYHVALQAEEAALRCGPGEDYYATDRLKKNDTVEVWRHDPAGWLAVRPPEGSYSLVAARHLRALQKSGMAEVVSEEAVAWVAPHSESDAVLLWQVRLKAGEVVELLGVEKRSGIGGQTDRLWCRVAPPAGEFRWIHRRDLSPPEPQPQAPVDAAKPATPPSATPPAAAKPTAPSTKPGLSVRGADRVAPQPLSPEEAVAALEAELDRLEAQDPATWRLDVLRKNAQTLSAHLDDASLAERARRSVERVDQMQAIKAESLVEEASIAQTAASEPVADLAALGDETFQGRGWLMPVLTRGKPAPPFALLDDSGRVAQFVTPAPGLNLRRHLRKRVGIIGQQTVLATFEAPHLTAHRVVALEE